MNRLIVKRMALSTLLLSSIATPVFADTGTASPPAQGPTATISTAAESTNGSKLLPLLEPQVLALVNRYAPETAQDWRDTLSRYHALTSTKALSVDLTTPIPPTPWTDKTGIMEVQLATTGTLTDAETVPLATIPEYGTAGGHAEAALSASGAVNLTLAGLNHLESGKLANAVTIHVAYIDGVFKEQAALAEAAQATDAAAIKQALSALLKQYKDLNYKLEEAK
ncbi:hypothetical protein [Paenibacillus sp. FSL R7-0337]|uniref:hypothetical protein n=1 Tax=Paenibacillus sp. FSL R7-0337 TaxID=1926588 RepID=UPI00096CCAA6|nr:hypothetical protein [Paenibacillus sp. FSL R7-0337]OMF96462.1 hypothetical protein BK147_13895 [Paenibacillus sp. FSL R7-0337]